MSVEDPVCVFCARHRSSTSNMPWFVTGPIRALDEEKVYVDGECLADIKRTQFDEVPELVSG